MKILLSFFNALHDAENPSVMPPFYEAFIEGLRRAGNEIVVFSSKSWQAGSIPLPEVEGLREKLRQWTPDVIVAFNNYGPEFLIDCDVPIVVYDVDSPLYYSHRERIRQHPERFRFVVVQESSRKALIDDFGVPAALISEAPFFTELRAEDCQKENNIVFIGSRFWVSPSPWHEFLCATSRSSQEREAYLRLLNFLRRNPFARLEAIQERFPMLQLTKQEIDRLIGDLSAERRELVLSAVADLGLGLYGTRDWKGVVNSRLALSYDDRRVATLRENQALYNASKLALNINHVQAREAFSWRVLDIMATSCCLVTEECEGIKRLFPGLALPTFRNAWEARQVCRRLLESKSERDELSAACRQIVDEKFRFRHVLPVLENAVGHSLSSGSTGSVHYVMPIPDESDPGDGALPTGARRMRKRHPKLQLLAGALMLMSCKVYRGSEERERKILSSIHEALFLCGGIS